MGQNESVDGIIDEEEVKSVLNSISMDATKLSKIIIDYKTKIQQLESEKKLRDEEVQQLIQGKEKAEKEAELANEKADKAKDFKNEIYASLTRELFDNPKNELKSDIIEQARRSNRAAYITAITSIILSLLITIYTQVESFKSTQKTNSLIETTNNNFSNMLSETKEIMNRTNDNFSKVLTKIDTNMIRNMNIVKATLPFDYKQKILSGRIAELSSDFSNYASKEDIALCYKIFLAEEFPEEKYEDFIRSFKISCPPSLQLTKEDFFKWNKDIIKLYENALLIYKEKKYRYYTQFHL
jgi:hypothetical protein